MTTPHHPYGSSSQPQQPQYGQQPYPTQGYPPPAGYQQVPQQRLQHPTNAPLPPPPPQQPKNGLGTAGFVLGLLALIFSFIPLVGVVAWPLGILGLVLAAVGWHRASQGSATNKGLAIAGTVLSVLALLVCILWVAAFGKAVDNATTGTASTPAGVSAPAQQAAAGGHTVTYQVSGPTRAGNVTYTEEGFQMEQASQVTLPWSKDLTFKDDVSKFSGLSLVAQKGGGSGDITCRILVDGKEIASSTSSGAYAVVTCNGINA